MASTVMACIGMALYRRGSVQSWSCIAMARAHSELTGRETMRAAVFAPDAEHGVRFATDVAVPRHSRVEVVACNSGGGCL